jgi:hypothetical protein
MRQPGPLLVGLYAWTVTVAFGAVLLDIVDATQVPRSSAAVLAEGSDLLLGLASLTVLAGIGAIAASWEWKPARYLVVASLVVVVAAVLTPAVLSDVIQEAERALGVRVGPWVRLGAGGLASILAFVGLRESWRHA